MADIRAFNLDAFKQGFGDGARANLFYYKPAFPSGIELRGLNQNLMFMVKSSGVPPTELEEVTANWQGYDFKYAGKNTFSDFTITFNVDVKANVRHLFEDWSKLAHNPETNVYGTHDKYMVDQKLQMLGYDGGVILEVTLHDAWPKSVGAITLDYATGDIVTFDVGWSYSYHKITPTGTGE